MAIQGLDDALSAVNATPSDLVPGSDDSSVLSRLEAYVGGEDAPVEEAEIEAEEETVETTEEEETEESTEATDEDETEETEDDEPAEESSEEETVELSEEQIAHVLGLPEEGAKLDDDGNLLLKTKVDGEVKYVSAEELTASFQLEKHLRNKSSVDAEARRQFEEFKTAETAKIQNTVTDATALVAVMEQQLSAAVQGTDFENLRKTNPGEFAALQTEIGQKQAQIGQIKQQLRGMIQQQQQEQQNQQEQQRQQRVLEETEALITKYPRWADADVATKEIDALQSAAVEAYGFTEKEISNLGDHRLILVLMDALKGRTVDEKTEVVKKKIKKIPKIVKPGNPKVNKTNRDQRAKQQKHQKLKESGSTHDAAAILYDRI